MHFNSINFKSNNIINDKQIPKNESKESESINSQSELSSSTSMAIMAINKSLIEMKSNPIDNIDTKYLFTPMSNIKKNLLNQLDELKEDKKHPFSDKLYDSMSQSIRENKFNLNNIYRNHYAYIDLCDSIDEIKENFPELRFPKNPAEQQNGFYETRNTNPISNERVLKGKYEPVNPDWRKIHTPEEISNLKILLKKDDNAPDKIEETANALMPLETNIPLTSIVTQLDKLSTGPFTDTLNFEQNKGVIKTLRNYRKSSNHQAILDMYKIASISDDSDNSDINKTIRNTLESGKKTKLATMLSSHKSEDIPKIYDIMVSTGSIVKTVDNSKELLTLYKISDNNMELVKDISSLFKSEEIKTVSNVIKEKYSENPDKLISYKSNYDIQNGKVKIDDIFNFCDDLNISSNKDIEKLQADIFKSAQPVDYKRTLSSRFVDKDYTTAVKSGIKQIYLDFKPLNEVVIPIGDDDNTFACVMDKNSDVNYKWSTPGKNLQKFLNHSKSIGQNLEKLSNDLSKLSIEDKKKLASKVAKNNFWRDYHNYTSCKWMPIRLIKDRQYNQKTTLYTLDNLTDAYLYKLYETSKKSEENGKGKIEFSTNPLKEMSENKHLNKYLKGVIDDSYLTIYNDRHENIHSIFKNSYNENESAYSNDKGFVEFCKENNFDKEEIKKSFECIEKLYKRRFFTIYLHNDRTKVLKKDMQFTLNLIEEKQNYKDTSSQENISVSNEDVENIENEVLIDIDDSERINEEKRRELQYILSNIENTELKNICRSALSKDIIDVHYFNNVYDTIITSCDKDKKLDEDKALATFVIQDKYIELNKENITEVKFTERELEKYKKENGEYDYKQYLSKNKEVQILNNQLQTLEKNGDWDVLDYVWLSVNYNTMSNNEAINFINKFNQLPNKKLKQTVVSKISENLKDVNELKNSENKDDLKNAFKLNEVSGLINKIDSWELNKHKTINLNDVGVDKRVIITKKAKNELWDATGNNIKLFDEQLNKYYSSATKRARSEKDNGIKSLKGSEFYEIKIVGDGGQKRMYSRDITEEDKIKYSDNNDKRPIAYIFDDYGNHT